MRSWWSMRVHPAPPQVVVGAERAVEACAAGLATSAQVRAAAAATPIAMVRTFDIMGPSLGGAPCQAGSGLRPGLCRLDRADGFVRNSVREVESPGQRRPDAGASWVP